MGSLSIQYNACITGMVYTREWATKTWKLTILWSDFEVWIWTFLFSDSITVSSFINYLSDTVLILDCIFGLLKMKVMFVERKKIEMWSLVVKRCQQQHVGPEIKCFKWGLAHSKITAMFGNLGAWRRKKIICDLWLIIDIYCLCVYVYIYERMFIFFFPKNLFHIYEVYKIIHNFRNNK